MVEMGVGVEDMADGESELLDFMKNLFGRPAGIDHDGLLRDWIGDDRAVASQGRDREGSPNQHGHSRGMLQSEDLKVQASGHRPSADY